MELLKHLSDDFTTELAKFNIEGNLDPLEFSKDCFSRLENNINKSLVELREVANKQDVDFVLTGVIPSSICLSTSSLMSVINITLNL